MTTSFKFCPWMRLPKRGPLRSHPYPYDGNAGISGQYFSSGMPRISAPSARNSVMWLVRLNGAVSHCPGGTLSWPPPLSASAAIASTARSNASVFTARPSPTPPKSVRLYAVGRSRGGSGAVRSLRNPPPPPPAPTDIEAFCHRNTRVNPTTHTAASSVLLAATNAATPRRWPCGWSLPPNVSTIWRFMLLEMVGLRSPRPLPDVTT
uniref:Uncharacterized protein n=1 Tax=Arundo donax TaxID=35708 RepID=A0A0A9FU99_ARUDO